MASLTGLHLRGSVYQLRTAIPTDLQARFGHECIRKSLGTSNRGEAELKGLLERARLLTLFAAARTNTQEQPLHSPKLQGALSSLQGITLHAGDMSAPAPTSEAAEVSTSAMEPSPAASSRTNSASRPYKSARGAFRLFASAPTLVDIFELWKKSGQRAQDTENACLRAVNLCQQALGKLPIYDLTRAHGDSFRAWLLTQGGSDKTARDRFTWVKSLLVYAYRELELLSKQPWEGMEIKVNKIQTRRAWRDEELKQLFSQPLFT